VTDPGRGLTPAEHIDAIYGLLLSVCRNIFGLIAAVAILAVVLLVVVLG
jgi:hypothetical protein